jgi:hypothetical protein
MSSDIHVFRPQTLGWLEKRMSVEEVTHLWNCIANCHDSYNHRLAGNIMASNLLTDTNNWFFNNTLLPLCEKYSEEFDNLGNGYNFKEYRPYILQDMWVNFQRQGEFNPIHDHAGVYSFVAWMKLPTEFNQQNQIDFAKNSRSPRVSAFEFTFNNILGEVVGQVYELGKEFEGVMLFFPAKLKHSVYPFFNSGEQRISISGNIGFDL